MATDGKGGEAAGRGRGRKRDGALAPLQREGAGPGGRLVTRALGTGGHVRRLLLGPRGRGRRRAAADHRGRPAGAGARNRNGDLA